RDTQRRLEDVILRVACGEQPLHVAVRHAVGVASDLVSIQRQRLRDFPPGCERLAHAGVERARAAQDSVCEAAPPLGARILWLVDSSVITHATLRSSTKNAPTCTGDFGATALMRPS